MDADRSAYRIPNSISASLKIGNAESLSDLVLRVQRCQICREFIQPRPILQIESEAKILIIGQAPGARVHESGKPWDDESGKRLRNWMGISDEAFYDAKKVALMPMGFCYPGSKNGSDLPPRPECAPTWHDLLLAHMPNIALRIFIGSYAQARYLGAKGTLTETVMNWRTHLMAGMLPLVHPSPRNGIWLRKNPWFEAEVVPALRGEVSRNL